MFLPFTMAASPLIFKYGMDISMIFDGSKVDQNARKIPSTIKEKVMRLYML
jgi:hypothetical protein